MDANATESELSSSSLRSNRLVAFSRFRYRVKDLTFVPSHRPSLSFPPFPLPVAVTAKLNASTGANEINIAQTLHRRSMVKFNTLGHSAVDVNLIAYGKGSEVLAGNHDNTEIGQFVIDMLNLDTSAITDKLNDPSNSEWLENEVGLAKVIGGVRVSGGAISRRGHGDLC
jgi:hypothetical protein